MIAGVVLLSVMLGAGPPAIRRQGVVNAASQRPAALGGGISRGSLICIYGVRFAEGAQANRVSIESAGRTHSLSIVRADSQRLEAWIPPDAPLGPTRLTVTSNGLESAPEEIALVQSAPGLFSVNEAGWGPARSSNTPENSVTPGGRVTLEATGLAPADRPEMRVGNSRARVVSIRAGTAPNYTARITLEIPADAPEGCYVPVSARPRGGLVSNTVTIAIHRGGGACVHAPNDPAGGWKGGRTALLALSRTVRRPAEAPQDRMEDEVIAGFSDVPPGKTRASPLLAMPPVGTCAAYTTVLTADTQLGNSVWNLLFGEIPGKELDAGASIDVRSQSVQLKVPVVAGVTGLYRRNLSATIGRVPPRNRVSLDSGRIMIAGTGGAQVGPFSVALPAPVAFGAPNPLANPAVRSGPVTVEWAGGHSEGSVAIILFGADANLNVAGMTYCTAPMAAGRFTIPAGLLAQLPAGRGDLVLASWWGQTISPPPPGIARVMAISAFARSFEIQFE